MIKVGEGSRLVSHIAIEEGTAQVGRTRAVHTAGVGRIAEVDRIIVEGTIHTVAVLAVRTAKVGTGLANRIVMVDINRTEVAVHTVAIHIAVVGTGRIVADLKTVAIEFKVVAIR